LKNRIISGILNRHKGVVGIIWKNKIFEKWYDEVNILE